MKEDIISQLPDPLLCQIFNHLRTKESVKTSILSTRWRNLWLWVPSLEMISGYFTDFDDFVSFGDRFLNSNRVACLQKLYLSINGNRKGFDDDVSYLTAWMDAAAKRKIQHLDFSWDGYCLWIHTKFLRLYKCETLVHLKLSRVIFDDADFVSFPCLKTMELEDVSHPNNAAFEKLVSRCPVLEELDIIDDDIIKGFQVLSQSLRRLTLVQEPSDFEVVIDAPLLCYLRIHGIERVIISNWESNAKLIISFPFWWNLDESMRSNIRKFLSGILRVGDMEIYKDAFKCIMEYSKVEPLPQFGYMSRLNAIFHASDLKYLLTFLESCPNLKTLELSWEDDNKEMSEMCFSPVPN